MYFQSWCKHWCVSADGVELLGDLKGRSFAGAFEDHVLDHVGKAILGCGFIPCSDVDPDPHGDAAYKRH